jgi:hypothetical protein
MRITKDVLIGTVLSAALLVAGFEPAVADSGYTDDQRSDSWKLTQGGKLYDN